MDGENREGLPKPPLTNETSKQATSEANSRPSVSVQKGGAGGILSKISSVFAKKPGQQPSQVEIVASEQAPLENPQQIKNRMAQLQADKLNITKFMKASDRSGSSQIADSERIRQIDERLEALRSKLPASADRDGKAT